MRYRPILMLIGGLLLIYTSAFASKFHYRSDYFWFAFGVAGCIAALYYLISKKPIPVLFPQVNEFFRKNKWITYTLVTILAIMLMQFFFQVREANELSAALDRGDTATVNKILRDK